MAMRTVAAATTASGTVTHRLADLARSRAGRHALIDAGAPGGHARQSLTYPGLAAALHLAAAGLAWHGLRRRDVCGVFVDDGASYAVAVHAIRAAGGIASPVAADAEAAAVAAQLADCNARMLITTPGLVGTALEAAERSWVRQVISFGEAPGAIAFGSLLSRGTSEPADAGPGELALLPYTASAAGRPEPVAFTHADLAGELQRLDGVGLTERDVVVAVPPTGDGRAYTVLLDLALIRGATVVAAGGSDVTEAARVHGGTAAIVPGGTGVSAGLALRTLDVTKADVTEAEDGSRTEC